MEPIQIKASCPEDVTGDNRWMDMHNRFKSEAMNASCCDILLIGDSIVQQMQFTKFYREHLPPNRTVLNFGIGGDRVEHVLWRIEDGEWLVKIKPKIIVLFVGTNNVKSTPEEVVNLLERVVDVMKAKSPASKIIIPLLLPKGQHPNKLRVKNKAVNDLLQAKYQESDISLIDMDRNRIISEDGTISHTILHDYLHLTNAGYELTWSSVLDACKEHLNADRVQN